MGGKISEEHRDHWLLVLANIGALLVIAFGSYTIHNRIEAKIRQIEEL